MDVARQLGRMDYASYLALEAKAAEKHEYVNGEVYAMAGGTPEHARLQSRLSQLLGQALEGKPCAVFSSDLRVRITATGRSTYPDLSIVCGRVETAADDGEAAVNPTVIVEVLSKTSEADDRGAKWAHYQMLATLKEYVLVSQDEPRIEVFRRDGTLWTYEAFAPGDQLRLSSLGIAVDVTRVYESPLGRAVSGE